MSDAYDESGGIIFCYNHARAKWQSSIKNRHNNVRNSGIHKWPKTVGVVYMLLHLGFIIFYASEYGHHVIYTVPCIL